HCSTARQPTVRLCSTHCSTALNPTDCAQPTVRLRLTHRLLMVCALSGAETHLTVHFVHLLIALECVIGYRKVVNYTDIFWSICSTYLLYL
ncbi:MAG: hypothetical protein HC827_22345, partial [Cyanobacteria bacterium RM1_2_2]|nr:hypothetical protein [Cyanobacteria bacterium RM1_2_2]